jgi:glycosyltransferase involved in cell wall biosynthesis
VARPRYVAFDVTPLQNGHRVRGIGTYVRGLAAQLMAQDEVPIELWGWADDPPLVPRPPHRAWWLSRIGVPRTRFPALLRLAMAFRSTVSSVGAVHVTDPNALVAPVRHRLMTTVYDLIPLHQGRSAEPPGYRRYLKRLQSVDTIFAISQATADDVVATLSVPQGRVVVARPGVELPPLVASSSARGKYFLYVGSPDPHKNLAVLLDAMTLRPQLAEKLVITGNWPDPAVSALRMQVEADPLLRGRVDHLGYVTRDELLSLFRSSTAVVMPSLFEGFGLPVAEAMAAGAAVVHSRLPVLEEVSAGCALTFAAASSEELAACLTRVSTDETLRRDLITRGRSRAESLTWAEALERTLQVYRETLRGDGRD